MGFTWWAPIRHYYEQCVILRVLGAGTKRSIIDEDKSGRIREKPVQEHK
ncbi:hypothetical protein PF005_g19366 [Phytophthora fragariae]|uniref:Uncharacterized protein n=1 Tax=Phytophthora fragariae TaxID=53985 RepID=A0A6A3XGU2_9STRA|nr:hypothetical protein PF011_g14508 [Phytophthora fragariae]KAE9116633.1 hypothetical protein PF006_g18991 [Phytophthora fragariae]KAE9190166.1 hypothetical protein PF005_g19366 [Phytophthora fragariae]KAE9202304.1 hypothetical protein PF002_g21289 [Phytophthora fragariae]KAE9216037.1 hypothetical protein PF004_g14573 [Phytophthora fragariae]